MAKHFLKVGMTLGVVFHHFEDLKGLKISDKKVVTPHLSLMLLNFLNYAILSVISAAIQSKVNLRRSVLESFETLLHNDLGQVEFAVYEVVGVSVGEGSRDLNDVFEQKFLVEFWDLGKATQVSEVEHFDMPIYIFSYVDIEYRFSWSIVRFCSNAAYLGQKLLIILVNIRSFSLDLFPQVFLFLVL